MSVDPTQLGDFTVVTRLGEGGSGTVYAARWTRAEEAVALKVLREAVTATEKERARFFEEAAKLRKVEHPSLVRVLDVGTLPDGRPYLVMPRLSGETLAQRLARGPLDPSDAIDVFEQLADGVGAIHDAGLVHRDIKPENVFLEDAPPGAPPRAILLDFGIARAIDRPDSTTTEAGVVRGTPAYMAPERFFGTPAGVRTDVYELALLLYMMLVGRLPWDPAADNASGRLQPSPPSALGAPVPSGLDTVLLRAMSTRPEVRPDSAPAFAREVRAAAAPATSAPPARRTAAFAMTSAPTTTGSTVIERREAPKHRAFLGVLAAVAAIGVVAVGPYRARSVAPQPTAAVTLTPAVIPLPTAPELPAPAVEPLTPPAPKPKSAVSKAHTLAQSPSPPPVQSATPLAPDPAPSASADPLRFYRDRK
jgi:serine/threonine-protein kinase